jgi:hypothetical protein
MINNFFRTIAYSQDERVIKNFCIIGSIILASALALLSVSRIIYPFDLGSYEAPIWEPALLSIRGYNPYSYALESPYIVAPYGYFYYFIIGLGLEIFDMQFWFGRTITVLAAIVCVICVGKIVMLMVDRKLLYCTPLRQND